MAKKSCQYEEESIVCAASIGDMDTTVAAFYCWGESAACAALIGDVDNTAVFIL